MSHMTLVFVMAEESEEEWISTPPELRRCTPELKLSTIEQQDDVQDSDDDLLVITPVIPSTAAIQSKVHTEEQPKAPVVVRWNRHGSVFTAPTVWEDHYQKLGPRKYQCNYCFRKRPSRVQIIEHLVCFH